MRFKFKVTLPNGSSREFEEQDFSQAEDYAAANPGATMQKRRQFYTITDDPVDGREFDWSDDAELQRSAILQPVLDAANAAYPTVSHDEFVEDL